MPTTGPPERPPFRPGHLDDFTQLYEQSYARLVRTLSLAFNSVSDAEDAVQHAFERAWRPWMEGKPIDNPEAWITRIAYRVAINRRAYDRLRSVPELIRRLGRPDDAADPGDSVVPTDLANAMSKLALRDRLIAVWFYDHGLPVAAIAERIGKSPRTVELRLAKVRETLRSELPASHRLRSTDGLRDSADSTVDQTEDR